MIRNQRVWALGLSISAVLLVCNASRIAHSESISITGLEHIDAYASQALRTHVIRSADILVLRKGATVYHKQFGAAQADSIYDLASLSKAVATTTAISILSDRGLLKTTDPVVNYVPDFEFCDTRVAGTGSVTTLDCALKKTITIEQLMRHRSGLRDRVSVDDVRGTETNADGFKLMVRTPVFTRPGSVFKYADINFIVLMNVAEKVLNGSMAEFLAKEAWTPLGMASTGYLPGEDRLARVLPTREDEDAGTVNDPMADALGGVSGNAGLFSTADDLSKFALMLLGKGQLGETRVLSEDAVLAFGQTKGTERGLGWDVCSAYATAVRGDLGGGFGHTGYTGTSMWLVPSKELAVIILTDRTVMGETSATASGIAHLRESVANLVAQAYPR